MLSSALKTHFNTQGPTAPSGQGTGSGLGDQLAIVKNILAVKYDFALQGGEVGTKKLLDMDGNVAVLPSGAIINRVYNDVITAFTSGGAATVALTSGEGAGDIKAAAAFDHASYGAGLQDTDADGAAANMVKLTADRSPSLVIAAAALTAGKMYSYIEYTLGSAT